MRRYLDESLVGLLKQAIARPDVGEITTRTRGAATLARMGLVRVDVISDSLVRMHAIQPNASEAVRDRPTWREINKRARMDAALARERRANTPRLWED